MKVWHFLCLSKQPDHLWAIWLKSASEWRPQHKQNLACLVFSGWVTLIFTPSMSQDPRVWFLSLSYIWVSYILLTIYLILTGKPGFYLATLLSELCRSPEMGSWQGQRWVSAELRRTALETVETASHCLLVTKAITVLRSDQGTASQGLLVTLSPYLSPRGRSMLESLSFTVPPRPKWAML